MLAAILRIIFSVMVVWLMKIPGLEFLGAILLLYVVWKFYREIRSSSHTEEIHEENGKNGLWGAIQMIIVADVAMSLDNVLAVAGASHGNYVNLMIGLVFSIVLMVVASGWIAKMLDKYPTIQWLGLFIILFTALEMLEKGLGKAIPSTAFYGIPESTIFTLLLIIVVGSFAVLQTRYFRSDYSAFGEWARAHGKSLMVTIFMLLILVSQFGAEI